MNAIRLVVLLIGVALAARSAQAVIIRTVPIGEDDDRETLERGLDEFGTEAAVRDAVDHFLSSEGHS